VKPMICNRCGCEMKMAETLVYVAVLERPVSGPASAEPATAWECECGCQILQLVKMEPVEFSVWETKP